MKILIINPNSDDNTNRIIEKKVELLLNKKENILIDVINIKEAPLLVGTYMDYHKSANRMVEIVLEDKYDAYIIGCHSDPNIDLIREITEKPVIGIGESSMMLASLLGNTFAVISPSLKSISKKRALARKHHLQDKFIGTKVTESDSKEDLLVASRNALNDFNVDAIVLGCANYALADKLIENELQIPVIDGIASALILAMGLSNYKEYKTNNL